MFELYGLHLLAWKKFEDALELSSVKSAIDVGKTPGVNWRRAADAGLFFSKGVKEVQRFAAFKSLHIPMGKCAFDRVSQNDEQFDVRIVIPDPFRRRPMIKITGGAITGDHRRSKRRIMFVQFLVIHCGNEVRVVIKKMDLLLVAHANVWMPAQEIMQRRCPGFLRSCQNEIELLDFSPSGSKHRYTL